MIKKHEEEEKLMGMLPTVSGSDGQHGTLGSNNKVLELVPLPPKLEVSSDPTYEYAPTVWPPVNTLFIEWIYIIDLDRKLFSVGCRSPGSFVNCRYKEGLTLRNNFKLDDIPEDWSTLIETARSEKTLLNGEFVNYPRPEPDQNLLALYSRSHPVIFQAPLMSGCPVDEVISTKLLQDFTRQVSDYENYDYFTFLHEWGPDDPQFKQLAFGILCLSSSPEISVSHAECVSTWFECAYPASSAFWFNGVYIIFETHLDNPDNLKAAVGKAIYTREHSPQKSFMALIFSIQHVVVIEFNNDGTVNHTMPILVIDNLQDIKLRTHVAFSDPQNLGFRTIIATLSRGNKELIAQKELKDGPPNSANLPNELLLYILSLVDLDTRTTLRKSSRLFRRLADLNRRIGPYTLKHNIGGNTFAALVEGSGKMVFVRFEKYILPEKYSSDESPPPEAVYTVKFSHQGAKVKGLPFYFIESARS